MTHPDQGRARRALAGNRMLQLAAAGAIVTVGLFTALSRWPDRYLLVAASVALTVMIPGLLLVRAEPKGRFDG